MSWKQIGLSTVLIVNYDSRDSIILPIDDHLAKLHTMYYSEVFSGNYDSKLGPDAIFIGQFWIMLYRVSASRVLWSRKTDTGLSSISVLLFLIGESRLIP